MIGMNLMSEPTRVVYLSSGIYALAVDRGYDVWIAPLGSPDPTLDRDSPGDCWVRLPADHVGQIVDDPADLPANVAQRLSHGPR